MKRRRRSSQAGIYIYIGSTLMLVLESKNINSESETVENLMKFLKNLDMMKNCKTSQYTFKIWNLETVQVLCSFQDKSDFFDNLRKSRISRNSKISARSPAPRIQRLMCIICDLYQMNQKITSKIRKVKERGEMGGGWRHAITIQYRSQT